VLRSFLERSMPREVLEDVRGDLDRWGGRVAGEVWPLGQECEANPPRLEQTDAWGHRVDRLVTCSAWRQQKVISAEEGLIAIPYAAEQGEHSRLYQMAKLYMYAPASGLFSCPLAMTDGAAATLRSLGLQAGLGEAWRGLTSRDPGVFWTSGQWMTEPRGGSDVGRATETVAVRGEGGGYRLHGYKWFSSATDSDMALTLARVAGPDGVVGGSRGLSMFYLKTRGPDGQLNGIHVAKMKNKLGTRQLPTAELLLDGAEATMVGEEGRGVPAISTMLAVTRLHNTVAAVASMRKICCLARDYARRRQAFGRSLAEHPLHLQSLARMEVETRGCLLLLLELARQLGLVEAGVAGDQDTLLLRLFTPVAKFYTAKAAVATVSEGLECFGGQGYIEDTGLPGLLRDAQVLPIWEGTSSVMALDVVRALAKSQGAALDALLSRLSATLAQAEPAPTLARPCTALRGALSALSALEVGGLPQAAARDLSLSLARTYVCCLLVEQAVSTGRAEDALAAEEWAGRELVPVVGGLRRGEYEGDRQAGQGEMVYSGYCQEDTYP
jgi:alkylation response protein AidB-like acyl-CoA dehydrogenase